MVVIRPIPAELWSIDGAEHCAYVASFVHGTLADITQSQKGNHAPFDVYDRPLTIVAELPQVYRAGRSKADPNDLVKLAFWLGVKVGSCRYDELHLVLPNRWKGTVPKDIMQTRIDEALSEDERRVLDSFKIQKSLKHNLYDAVGIGLWFLGRLTR